MPPRFTARTGSVSGSQQCLRPWRNGSQLRQHRDFSQSSGHQFQPSCKYDTRLRRNMFGWLNGPGRVFREPLAGEPNYLSAYDKSGKLLRQRDAGRRNDRDKPAAGEEGGEEEEEAEHDFENDPDLSEEEKQERREAKEADAAETPNARPRVERRDLRPYPLNRAFQSQSVLSEALRDEIYKKVVDEKLELSTVSALFGVDMRRVAAVVRLMTVEKDWVAKGKKLATPYAEAVLQMLPQTRLNAKRQTAHEAINDLPVHPYTRQQIFYPTSESRQFTRADAAKVFSPTLLPADERIPIPELIQIEQDTLKGVSREERNAKTRAKDEKVLKQKQEKERKQKEWEAENIKVVGGQRWNFRFQNINVEDAGKDGRGRNGVGWRYGDPHHDRKRGAVKIPTSVE